MENDGNTLIIVAVLAIFVLFFVKLLKKKSIVETERKCAWCNGHKLTLTSGKEGSMKWKYRNKDGSQDKRRKDNLQQAFFQSVYKCEECNASTQFLHKESQSPGPREKILKRKLKIQGTIKRKGSDFGV